MEQEFIRKIEELFDSSAKWNSFVELSAYKDKIVNKWHSKLKDQIEIKIRPEEPWAFRKQPTQWYIREYGEYSLSLWLEGESFSLWAHQNYFDTNLINQKLKEPRYRPINEAVLYKSSGYDGSYFFREKGRFEFGSVLDNNFDNYSIAWFAGNETERFTSQIEEKLKPFLSEETTNLIIELNRLSKK